jgi:hypothetical protein
MLAGRWGWKVKLKQAKFLIKAGIYAPFGGLFWYLDDLLFPGYHHRHIKPVFIVGQPRCGTTFLHRTLAKDGENFFAVRHLEWRYPSITQRKLIRILGLEKRLLHSNYWSDTTEGQLAAKMHPNTLGDWEEDGIFFEENYLLHFFIYLRFPEPQLLSRLDGFGKLPLKTQEKMLKNHHKALQKVAYQRGPENRLYLSKEVTSHYKIPVLMALYPDARFIVTVRPADTFMSSLLALMSTRSKIGLDPIKISRWEEVLTARMRRECDFLVYLCREKIPESQQVLISAGEMLEDIDAAVRDIYQALGLSVNETFRDFLKDQSEEQKTRQPGYSYNTLELEGFEGYEQFVKEVSARFQGQSNSPSCPEAHSQPLQGGIAAIDGVV